jgi:predicted ArsR family transcriptional regulator
VKKAFGEDGLDRLLKLRNAELEKTYRAKTDRAHTLKSKLDALARIRSAEGYLAEVRRDSETGDWLFVENHCPICAAARLCTGRPRGACAVPSRSGQKHLCRTIVAHPAGAGRCAIA